MKLNLKDILVPAVARELKIPEETVDTVITHQFKHLFSVGVKTFDELEVTGFGKFSLSQKRLKDRIQDYENIRSHYLKTLLSSPDDAKTIKKLAGLEADLAAYKNRLK